MRRVCNSTRVSSQVLQCYTQSPFRHSRYSQAVLASVHAPVGILGAGAGSHDVLLTQADILDSAKSMFKKAARTALDTRKFTCTSIKSRSDSLFRHRLSQVQSVSPGQQRIARTSS